MASHRAAPADPDELDTRIERSADPTAVRLGLERLGALHGDALGAIGSGRVTDAVVAVTAASRSLTRLLTTDPAALPVLRDLDRRPRLDGASADALVRWKHHELLRIAARDLLGLDPLEATTGALAALAADVLEAACSLLDARGLAVIGMGKLGGAELNYASDVDVMFVGEPDDTLAAARALVGLVGRCYRVDVNLRPEGRDGPLVRSLGSFEAYWDRWAQPWEFQALVRARPVAGDADLGRRFDDAARHRVWNHPLDADAIRQLRQLKERSEQAVVAKGLADREVKRGPGGIRDIEFTVQLLQLVHGPRDPDLRSPTTLVALAELAAAGYVDEGDAAVLAEHYRFLRALEHRLQLVDERQTHTVPANPVAREHLARVLGFRGGATASAVERFDERLRRAQHDVRTIHERIYFRPLLEAFVRSAPELSPSEAEARLAAFGFTDGDRTKAAIRELTRGLNRSSRLMRQMLPLLLDWLSGAPDPDLGLLVLRNLLAASPRRAQIIEAFRDSPEVARCLCLTVGTSRHAGVVLARNPDLVARLPHPDRLRTRGREELVASAGDAVLWRPDVNGRQEALRRWKDRHLLGVTARDILHDAPVEEVGRALSTLAEASIEVALRSLDPQVPFAVVALGRLGGAELAYASDLDLVFVHDADTAAGLDEATRIAQGLLRTLAGASPAERLYAVDAALRPEGTQGAMTRSVDGFRRYFERWALVWERQAYLRARPVAGDLRLGAALIDALEPLVWDRPLTPADEREIRRTKVRVDEERPRGVDTTFHLKFGRGALVDIEWTVQLLQLRHRIRAAGTIDALAALRAADLLDGDDGEILVGAYRFLERTRNRLWLVSLTPTDALPAHLDDARPLARSLGTTPGALREDFRRHTRRARRVVERLFYGAP